ncbi:hypothetical protein [Haladaptatus caseinilyticus]|uniref:hypothetical protein n=1 Tax=Haladaptatus caseinilyticus TaxID=2993314 RepID=UPI00224B9E0B|nr:hypothetical protein [Haladaptatus caseinilyticus]
MAHDCEPPHTPTRDDHSEWSPDDKITEAEIKETFEQCPHCGTYIVQCNGSHSCIPADYQPHADEPEIRRRIEASPFPDDDPVLIRKHKRHDTYAYHEPDSDDTPLCSLGADQSFLTRTREHAHEQFLAPCQRCERIREKQEGE